MIETESPQVVEMGNDQIDELLERLNFGHLGLCRDNRPYVLPIHFAYDKPALYFFTTEGLKTDIIDENPTICLQVEEVKDRRNWHSVVVTGHAQRLTDEQELDAAMTLIKAVNPELVPAWSIHWMDESVRLNIPVVYRVTPETITGRTAFRK